MKIPLLKILYFLAVTLLFALGFYRNQWQVVDMSEVEYRRDVSEIYVLGRLVKSQQDGVLSAGGLLGIGDVSESSVDGAVINNQYDKYNKGKGFSQYWVYKSHPGFQGILYSIFDLVTDFTPMRNLSLFRMAVSLLLSISLSMFCLWVGEEIGWLASICVMFFVVISKWLAILGGNMFWSLWVFYLPLSCLSLYIKRIDDGNNSYSKYMVIVFILSLIKILFSGFEFITSGLLMITVPFVYSAVLNNWGWNLFVHRMVGVGIGLVSSVVAGLIILAIQIKSIVGSYKEVLEYIIFAWSKRTYGYEVLLGDPSKASESSVKKTLEVVNYYLNGHAFSLSSFFSTDSPLINDMVNGKYLYLIILFAVVTAIFLLKRTYFEKIESRRVGVALVVATWFSILGPLSWLIVFRDHAALHTRLDFIVWQMPFTLYGFALVGFVLSSLVKYKYPKPSQNDK